jgi:signal transduction histidine kinase
MPANRDSSERSFAALSSLLNVGVLTLAADARPLFASQAACDLLGCPGEEALKERWASVEAPLLQLTPERLPRTRQPLRYRLDLRVGAVDRLLRIEAGALDGSAEAGWLVLIKDRKSIDAVDAALLLASGRHTASYLDEALRHDLKTPLNSMQITLELLAESVADDPGLPADERGAAQQRYLKVLRDDVSRLNRQLQLAVLQPVSDAAAFFDLGTVVRDTAARLESQARRQRIRLHVQLADGAVTLQGAESRLRQALLNIAVALLETLPEGGRLSFDAAAEGPLARLIVGGDGAAIAESTLDEIERLAGAADAPSAAMGLRLARVVVESLGGDFRIEPAGERGCAFRLILPRGHPGGVAAARPTPAGSQGGE